MRSEWCYFKSYFTKEECDKIVGDALKLPSQDAVVGVNGINTAVDTNIRKSKVRFISDKDPNFTWLFDKMWKTAIEANRDFFDIHITRLEFIQFAEYDSNLGGEYKEHHDVFWLNNDSKFHRKLSGIVQLSDPNQYENGEFEITETVNSIDKDIKEQGTVVYFPSMLRHKANKVTKGIRYSLAVWFEGPKWR